MREDWNVKLNEDLAKIKKYSHPCDRVVFLTTASPTATEKDNKRVEVKRRFGWDLELYDLERIATLVDNQHPQLRELHPDIFFFSSQKLPAELGGNDTNVFRGEQPRTLPSTIPPPKDFVGRAAELASLREKKQNGRSSFVLHGQGGVGKTELALQFAEEIKSEVQAHLRVDMRGLENRPTLSADAMLEIVRSFDPSASVDLQPQEIVKLYVHFLNKYKTLILFDNAKDRSQVEPLNHANALVLITSRTIFNVSGGVSLEIQQMSIEDARLLLYSVANEARFEGTADALADLAGYLPMALLPLASILADDQSVEAMDLLQKYSDRKERLRLEDPNRGNISVEASFDLSYERLTDELKACWRRLSVFPSDFDLEAMQAVWTVDQPKAIRSELTRSHLLTFDADSKRSSLHALARDYALGQMTENELVQTRTLHSAHYGAVLTMLETVTLKNLALFDVERTNIEAGFEWVEKNLTKDDQFAELCTYYTGYASDLLFQRISLEEMERWQKAGLFAYRKLGNRIGEAYSESNLARIASYKGQHFKAIGGFKSALSKVEDLVPEFEGEWLGNLANVYLRLQRYQNAIRYHKKALEVSKQFGNRSAVARHLGNLGFTYLNLAKKEADLGNNEKASPILESAFTYLKEALEIEEINITSKAIVLMLLSKVYSAMEDEERAESFRAEAVKIKEALESPSSRILRMSSIEYSGK